MTGKEAHHGRGDRLIKEEIHDPYMKRSKPAEPTVCPSCEVVFSNGRWHWSDQKPAGAHEEFCPACQRIRDKAPAGFLTLSGDFLAEHRDEIMNLVHNKVEQEMQEHPFNRLMAFEEQDDGSLLLSFTDLHLPRGVGEALQHAYKGELKIDAPKDEFLVRVYWQR
ncbi:BCAM0308 family protein [Emcibacter nanhaiensis]|uniref:ATPase n=1 Tax=Emcibacter nanhaiensis TaxID=1505037 RepID=A0A501PCL7_9PROT|nr:BCAM0308 family protein [Emcibacter nanhaiensis]TPD57801.1 ATPase [Emcibacter nanhaiensis]